MNSIRKALIGAFFVFPINAFCAECVLSTPAQHSTLSYVIDGDSLQLSDARQIRLLGINAPEMHLSATRKPAPFAAQAQQALRALLPKNSVISYHSDREKQDRYHRLLAQVLNANGVDVAAELLKQGYAEVLLVPPNTHLADCYLALEQQARKNKKGLWAQTTLWQTAAQLREANDSAMTEFVHIYGRVGFAMQSGRAETFMLDRRLHLQINDAALNEKVKARQNKTIYIRGYLRWKNQKAYLTLKHSAQIVD